MRRRGFVALLLAGALAFACGRATRLPAIPSDATVLAFGDSVTFGTGAAPGEDWPSLLAARTGWQVINAGVSGDTAAAGKERIGALIDEHRPALVIVEIGGNDFLRRRPPGEVKNDIRQIIGSARPAPVVLVAVPELSLRALAGKPGDAAIYRELAQEEKLTLVADVFAGVLADPALRADTIHPNAAGYRRMADGIHEALVKSGLSAK